MTNKPITAGEQTAEQIWEQINDLQRKIDSENFWIEKTSNPMKLRRRYRDIREYKKRIAVLKTELQKIK